MRRWYENSSSVEVRSAMKARALLIFAGLTLCVVALVLARRVTSFSSHLDVSGNGVGTAPVWVGEIKIVGNNKTSEEEIRKCLPLYPGQVMDKSQLRLAERNLESLNLFVVDADKGIRPTVTVLDDDNAAVQDILIKVNERP